MEGPSVEHMALPCVLSDGCRVRVYDSEGEFKAIYVYDLKKQLFITEKMFLQNISEQILQKQSKR